MAKFSVVYDACVLYPAPLRDLLMRLAMTDLFRARLFDDYSCEHSAKCWREKRILGFAPHLFAARTKRFIHH